MEGKRFVGLDLGKRTYEACAMLPDASIRRWNGTTDPVGREKLCERLQPGDVVCMEAGTTTFSCARSIKQIADVRCIILNPGKLAVIYASMKKTDKEDALKLARLAKTFPEDALPIVSLPTLQEEQERRLIGAQIFLKQERTRLINRIHGLFANAGITTITKKDLSTPAYREVAITKLDTMYQSLARQLMTLVDDFEQEIRQLNTTICEQVEHHGDEANRLLSVPGVGPMTALTLLAYLGDGTRFANSSQVSYFAGMVPRIDSSGMVNHYGHITKQGNSNIRRAITQAAWALVRSKQGGHLKDVYARLIVSHSKKVAIVAVARRLLELCWVLIIKKEYYRYSTMEERIRKILYYKKCLAGTREALT